MQMRKEVMHGQNRAPVKTFQVINVVDEKLAAKLEDFRMRLSAIDSGYPVLTDWHPAIPQGWGEFPHVPFQRATIYRGSAETWAYTHHHTITKFGDRYVASWSNGLLHEDYVGQEVHFASSPDGLNWSEPGVVVSTPVESELVRNNAGLYCEDGRLYCYVGVAREFGRAVADPGMLTLTDEPVHLDVYETTDLENWTQHEDICRNVYLFEGPRRTAGGKLICCGFDLRDEHGMVLIWDKGARPTDPPRVIDIPDSPDGVLPEQGTWYQTDDGCIWMYLRDGTVSCRLALSWSEDEGETWSPPLRTDFPNTFSRAFAGRLTDGRYYPGFPSCRWAPRAGECMIAARETF